MQCESKLCHHLRERSRQKNCKGRPQGGHVLSKYFPGTARKPELLQPNYLKEEKEEVRLERGWSQTWCMCESIL